LFDGGDTDLYGYCINDPVNLIDPEGLKSTLRIIENFAGIPGKVLYSSSEGVIGQIRPATSRDIRRYGLDPMEGSIVYRPNALDEGYIGPLSSVMNAYKEKYAQEAYIDFLIDNGFSLGSLVFAIGSGSSSGGLAWALWTGSAACDAASYARSGDETQLIPSVVGNPALGKIGGVLGVGGATIKAARNAQ
jgi:hypothetical protein